MRPPPRSQTLLIYFATDDAANLRPIAKRRWSPHGRVVFGPLQREIGHMSPQWTQKDLGTCGRDARAILAPKTSEYANSDSFPIQTIRILWSSISDAFFHASRKIVNMLSKHLFLCLLFSHSTIGHRCGARTRQGVGVGSAAECAGAQARCQGQGQDGGGDTEHTQPRPAGANGQVRARRAPSR